MSDAIVAWTGIKEFASRHRDDSRIPDTLGPDGAGELRALVRELCAEFDAFDANLNAPDLPRWVEWQQRIFAKDSHA